MRFALIGYGPGGRPWAAALEKAGRLAFIVDGDAANRARARASYGRERVKARWPSKPAEDVLAAVIADTPDAMFWATDLIAGGYHALLTTDQPLSSSEYDTLQEIATGAQVAAGIAYRPFFDETLAVAVATAAKIGGVRHLEVDLHVTHIPDNDADILMNLGPDAFAVVGYLANEAPDTLIALGNGTGPDRRVDAARVWCEWPNGATCDLGLAWGCAEPEFRARYLGTLGEVLASPLEGEITAVVNGIRETRMVTPTDCLSRAVEDFVESVEQDEEPLAPLKLAGALSSMLEDAADLIYGEEDAEEEGEPEGYDFEARAAEALSVTPATPEED